MGPGFGDDPAPGAPLHDVVAYGCRRVQSFLKIARFEQLLRPIGVIAPDTRQTVSLEFEPDTQLVGFRLT